MPKCDTFRVFKDGTGRYVVAEKCKLGQEKMRDELGNPYKPVLDNGKITRYTHKSSAFEKKRLYDQFLVIEIKRNKYTPVKED
jgi:hypothetical protein